MLIPARRDFRLARFFSNRFRTELTNPALWPLAVVGDISTTADSMKAVARPRGKSLFINTPKILVLFPRLAKNPAIIGKD